MGNLGEDTKNRNFSLFSFDSGLYDGLVNFVSCLLLFCVLLIQLIGSREANFKKSSLCLVVFSTLASKAPKGGFFLNLCLCGE